MCKKLEGKMTDLCTAEREEGHPVQRGRWVVENHTLTSLVPGIL